MKVKIIGAGLAGSEAAYQLAKRKIKVELYEMRPLKMTPVHKSSNFAELVCSNSFRSEDILSAVGLLKNEMILLDSLIIKAAIYAKIPAGGALAVDRDKFSLYVEENLKNNPYIKIYNEEVKTVNENEYTIITAGPLISDELFNNLKSILGNKQNLHFYDAVAPIIAKNSIDMNICYLKNRYDKGEPAYINCPMNEEEYQVFYNKLISFEDEKIKEVDLKVFEACMPIEVMAKRGRKTLTFGPLKPVGLAKTNEKMPYAVVQLRRDDMSNSMYNMVGFQTGISWKNQKELINLIPGLKNAEILRYGVIHRNSYIESPNILNNSFQVVKHPKLFFAGQISGTEGYVESAASGLNAAIQISSLILKQKLIPFPEDTMIGSLAKYISTPNKSFVPMHANFGILKDISGKNKKKEKKEIYANVAITSIKKCMDDNDELF